MKKDYNIKWKKNKVKNQNINSRKKKNHIWYLIKSETESNNLEEINRIANVTYVEAIGKKLKN